MILFEFFPRYGSQYSSQQFDFSIFDESRDSNVWHDLKGSMHHTYWEGRRQIKILCSVLLRSLPRTAKPTNRCTSVSFSAGRYYSRVPSSNIPVVKLLTRLTGAQCNSIASWPLPHQATWSNPFEMGLGSWTKGVLLQWQKMYTCTFFFSTRLNFSQPSGGWA